MSSGWVIPIHSVNAGEFGLLKLPNQLAAGPPHKILSSSANQRILAVSPLAPSIQPVHRVGRKGKEREKRVLPYLTPSWGLVYVPRVEKSMFWPWLGQNHDPSDMHIYSTYTLHSFMHTSIHPANNAPSPLRSLFLRPPRCDESFIT